MEDNNRNVQSTMIRSERKSSRRLTLETGIEHINVLRILHLDLEMETYHIKMIQALSDAIKLLVYELKKCY